jgi:hypothetical protein
VADDKLDPVLEGVDSRKREFLKKLILGTAFAVPMVASYSVRDLAYDQSPIITTVTLTTEQFRAR